MPILQRREKMHYIPERVRFMQRVPHRANQHSIGVSMMKEENSNMRMKKFVRAEKDFRKTGRSAVSKPSFCQVCPYNDPYLGCLRPLRCPFKRTKNSKLKRGKKS